MLKFLIRFSTKFDRKSPINCVNQCTETMLKHYTRRATNPTKLVKTFLSHFNLTEQEARPFLGTIFLFFGDLHLCCASQPFSEYMLLLLSKSYKTLM